MKYVLGSSLLAFALICSSGWAQRVSMSGHPTSAAGGGPVATSRAGNGAVGNRRPIGPGGCSRGNCLGNRRDRFFPNYYWPAYYWGYSPYSYSYGALDPYWELDESSDGQPSSSQQGQPQVIVLREPDQEAASVPAASPQVIEVPPEKTEPGKHVAPAGPVPPAVFIFTNGQRVEAQRYLLTQDMLQVQQGRDRQSIPLREINLEATIAANHARGIDLQIPENKNQLTLGF